MARADDLRELVDVYDDDRILCGAPIDRFSEQLGQGRYMVYVLALLQDEHDRILICQRALDKQWGAGWWEIPGGGARAGETSDQALVREVAEEVGLRVPHSACELVYSYKNVDPQGKDNYFADIYRCKFSFSVDDIVLQEEETIACKLATREEIDDLHKQGIFLHYERLCGALAAAGA